MILQKTPQYRSWVEINMNHFTHNWEEIVKLAGPGAKVLQVVKADAYGHGAVEISKAALRNGVACLGVANADEGVQLRVSGIKAPILILSPSIDSEIDDIVKYSLMPALSDITFAQKLNDILEKKGDPIGVHIEVDTGMGRGGALHDNALEFVKAIYSLSHLKVEGIFSHFSSSEKEDDDYNEIQWNDFRKLLNKLNNIGITIPVRHISNSGGILNFKSFNLDMVRAGIMSYGIYPSRELQKKADLLPVMSFKSRVILVKEFSEGCSIGYNRTYITNKKSRIATIPVGYGDGYGFILSNSGDVLIRCRRAPVVGRISMDLCTVDVTHIPDCQIGDEVVLMGRQGNEYISANEIAEKSKTISYEILCVIGKRAPRVFINNGKTDSIEPRLKRIFIPDEEKSIARINTVIRNCLHARTLNPELGDAIYSEVFETLFGREKNKLELRSGFSYQIEISEYPQLTDVPSDIARDYFQVTTHIKYDKTLRNKVFAIGCAANSKQLSDLFEDEQCEYRWLLNGESSTFTERDFKVNLVKINGNRVPVIKKVVTDRGYEVWCGSEQLHQELGKEVTMEIEIATRQYKYSNNFPVFLVYPTRGIDITFDYSQTQIKDVRQISFFGGKQPIVKEQHEQGKAINLKIANDTWIVPTSGVAFIWNT